MFTEKTKKRKGRPLRSNGCGIKMDRFLVRDLFGIEGLNIAWYGVIICFGMVLGIAVAWFRSKKMGVNPDFVFDFCLLAFPLAIIGARLYYVAFQWEVYADDPIRILYINEGGLAIYGAVLGGVLAALIFAWWKKISFWVISDIAIPSLILGQAIGRWGNFVNQEAFGEVIKNEALQFFPYGVYIEDLGEWHQATFFYESLWCFVVFGALLLISRKEKTPGVLLSVYCMLYGLERFVVEQFRTDSLMIGPLRVSQVLSAVIVAVGIVLFVFLKRGVIKSEPRFGKYALVSCEEKVLSEADKTTEDKPE